MLRNFLFLVPKKFVRPIFHCEIPAAEIGAVFGLDGYPAEVSTATLQMGGQLRLGRRMQIRRQSRSQDDTRLSIYGLWYRFLRGIVSKLTILP